MTYVPYVTALSLNCDLWGGSSGSYEVKTSCTPTRSQALWETQRVKHVSCRQEANTESRLWKTRLPYMEQSHNNLETEGARRTEGMILPHLGPGPAGNCPPSCFLFLWTDEAWGVCVCALRESWAPLSDRVRVEPMEAPPSVWGEKRRKAGMARKA